MNCRCTYSTEEGVFIKYCVCPSAVVQFLKWAFQNYSMCCKWQVKCKISLASSESLVLSKSAILTLLRLKMKEIDDQPIISFWCCRQYFHSNLMKECVCAFLLHIKRHSCLHNQIFPVSCSLTRKHMLRWALPEWSATRCYASCITATRRWDSIDHYVAGLILWRVQDNHVDLVVFLFRLLSGCWMW